MVGPKEQGSGLAKASCLALVWESSWDWGLVEEKEQGLGLALGSNSVLVWESSWDYISELQFGRFVILHHKHLDHSMVRAVLHMNSYYCHSRTCYK